MKTAFLRITFTLLFGFIAFGSQAQIFNKDEESFFPFRISLGYNFVNDSFSSSKYMTDVDAWSPVVYPSRIGVERVVYGDLSLEGAFSYNEHIREKNIGGKIIHEKKMIHAYDLSFKYSFRNVFWGEGDYKTPFMNHFDPYLNFGLGYNTIGENGDIYGIIGGGVVYWLSKDDEFAYNYVVDRIGILAQAQGKAGANNNFAQLTFGLIYKFK